MFARLAKLWRWFRDPVGLSIGVEDMRAGWLSREDLRRHYEAGSLRIPGSQLPARHDGTKPDVLITRTGEMTYATFAPATPKGEDMSSINELLRQIKETAGRPDPVAGKSEEHLYPELDLWSYDQLVTMPSRPGQLYRVVGACVQGGAVRLTLEDFSGKEVEALASECEPRPEGK